VGRTRGDRARIAENHAAGADQVVMQILDVDEGDVSVWHERLAHALFH
jgi:hypothetical protein